jgi:hypothetical protein
MNWAAASKSTGIDEDRKPACVGSLSSRVLRRSESGDVTRTARRHGRAGAGNDVATRKERKGKRAGASF